CTLLAPPSLPTRRSSDLIGLALQGSLSNLAAGVLLVTFRPFRSGEYVDLGGIAGTVLQVQIFSTTLRTVDGRIVVVPNGKIIARSEEHTSELQSREKLVC